MVADWKDTPPSYYFALALLIWFPPNKGNGMASGIGSSVAAIPDVPAVKGNYRGVSIIRGNKVV